MERRRFVISLADDELSQELRNTNFQVSWTPNTCSHARSTHTLQIVFTLIPSQFHGKLFDTVHPVAWKVNILELH